MNDRIKFFLKIFGFLLLIFLLGFLLYIFFFQSAPREKISVPPQSTTEKTTLPSAPLGGVVPKIIPPRENLPRAGIILKELPEGISAIANGQTTYAPTLIEGNVKHLALGSSGTDAIFYHPPEGKFYRILPDGNYSSLSNTQFFSVDKMTWAKNSEKAIMEYPDGSKLLYNFKTKEQVSLPKHWGNFDFSPNANEIVGKSIGTDRENRWLIVFSADGKNTERVESLGENANRVFPSWSPNQKILAMQTRDQDFDRQQIYPLGRHEENFKAFIVEGRDFISQWSPDGTRLLYSVYASNTNLSPMLWAVNASPETLGENRIRIPLQTWADKCVILNNETAYCGVPKNLPEGSGIIREVAKTIPDNLYMINYQTGAFSLIANFSEELNITEPTITNDGRYLFFVDGITSTLHRVQLK